MKKNRNQSLIGVVLVLIGIHLLSKSAWGGFLAPLSRPTWFFAGGSLLLLYHTKKKAWALAVGSMLILVGTLQVSSNGFLHPVILASLVFLVPGVVFMILYRQTNNTGFLVPSSILLGFGGFILSTLLGLPSSIQGSLFFILMGLSFIGIYFLGKNLIGRWPLFLGFALFAFGGLLLLTSTINVAMRLVPGLIPIILMGVGVWMLIQNKKE